MVAALVVLLIASTTQRVIGDDGARVITRIMGLLTVAFAVQYIFDGVKAGSPPVDGSPAPALHEFAGAGRGRPPQRPAQPLPSTRGLWPAMPNVPSGERPGHAWAVVMALLLGPPPLGHARHRRPASSRCAAASPSPPTRRSPCGSTTSGPASSTTPGATSCTTSSSSPRPSPSPRVRWARWPRWRTRTGSAPSSSSRCTSSSSCHWPSWPALRRGRHGLPPGRLQRHGVLRGRRRAHPGGSTWALRAGVRRPRRLRGRACRPHHGPVHRGYHLGGFAVGILGAPAPGSADPPRTPPPRP